MLTVQKIQYNAAYTQDNISCKSLQLFELNSMTGKRKEINDENKVILLREQSRYLTRKIIMLGEQRRNLHAKSFLS